MKCHYEVLSVSQCVTQDDLKKAYRKLVLQWHPDKNLGNTEECKQKFQLIQQAYETLSDPQERAWYDKHRDKILKGGENFKDETLDIFRFFDSSCYCGYRDDEKGFFTVYRGVFENLAAEDTPFLDQEELMPSFGNSKSPYDEVVNVFYGHWQSYCTAKTYVWLEEYDITEAPNRRVLRLMERENNKLRDQAKKKHNEKVRELVSFVRRRDPRVKKQKKILEEKKAENTRKAEEQRRKVILERRKEMSNYNESKWIDMSVLEANLQDLESHLDSEFGRETWSVSEEDGNSPEDAAEDPESFVEDNHYCIACDKMFQTEKTKLNHDNSKKHKANVAHLKEALEEDDTLIANHNAVESLQLPENNAECDNCRFSDDQLDAPLTSESDSQDVPAIMSRNARKKKKAVATTVALNKEHKEKLDFEHLNGEHFNGDHPKGEKEESMPPLAPILESKEKKKRRRAKQPKATTEETVEEVQPEKIQCGTCRSEFPSRNKLFSHLKLTRHSVYLEEFKAKPLDKYSNEKPERRKKGKTKQRDF